MKLRKSWKLKHSMKYKQLDYDQRLRIHTLLKIGCSQTFIANEINVSKSTVSRELKRNSGLRGYRHRQADRNADERRRRAAKHIRFTDDGKADVVAFLRQDWSPEQISRRLKVNNKPSVSHETIYRFILDNQ